MLTRLLKRITNWFKDIFHLHPAPVHLAMPQTIQESDIVKYARKNFNGLPELRYRQLDSIQSNMKERVKLLIEVDQVFGSNVMMDSIAVLAAWMADKVHGIKIAIGSPNLNMSYAIRRQIDEATKNKKKKVNNKDTVIFDNDARIDIVTHNRLRGHEYDFLLMNAVDFMEEHVLINYLTLSNNMTLHQNGSVVAFCETIDRVKTPYFPGYTRLELEV